MNPRYRDKVIGTWTRYGYFVGDGAQTAPDDGAWVATTQLYEFAGLGTFVSSGTENPVGGPAVLCAVTGRTGTYEFADGQIRQEALGFNASEGLNSRHTAELRLADPDRSHDRTRPNATDHHCRSRDVVSTVWPRWAQPSSAPSCVTTVSWLAQWRRSPAPRPALDRRFAWSSYVFGSEPGPGIEPRTCSSRASTGPVATLHETSGHCWPLITIRRH